MELNNIDILLVEDNPADVRLMEKALAKQKLRLNLHVVRDGAEALAFLKKDNPYQGVSTPDLILLDLNLPKVHGRDVLEFIKTHADLKVIPVVILTSSSSEEDIIRSYKLHANCYVTKPVDFDKFREILQATEHFWFTIVKLPSKEKANGR